MRVWRISARALGRNRLCPPSPPQQRRGFVGPVLIAATRTAVSRFIVLPTFLGYGTYQGYKGVKESIPNLPDLPDVDSELEKLKTAVEDADLSPLTDLLRGVGEVLKSSSDTTALTKGTASADSVAAAAEAVAVVTSTSLAAASVSEVAGGNADTSDDVGDDQDRGLSPAALRQALHMLRKEMNQTLFAAEEERAHNEVKDLEIQTLKTEVEQLSDNAKADVFEVQTRMQSEVERLAEENKELRELYLQLKQKIRSSDVIGGGASDGGRSLIDMYSDVLDLMARTDSTFDVTDHLPRVVVVGDQSAGKTSVLEMICNARVFPRGSGEMMTRSPIQVTLSESHQRVANFKGESTTYDLANEDDLRELRAQIETRMHASLVPGQAVTKKTVSLHVKSPGLPRMVLVDLPGIIGHVTAGMQASTKDDIRDMCLHHITNPNAIILCVQDGSMDAERSNIADVVTKADPYGKRTIFVLTKMDLAEKLNTSVDRVRRILKGETFRMNALQYFAVITGRGNSNDSIADIKEYEQQFFASSKLVQQGALTPDQATTANLVRAVQQEFWNKVRESIGHEHALIKKELTAKEVEWRNKYKGRSMSRDEVFQLAKHEVLEQMADFGAVTALEWEEIIADRLHRSLLAEQLQEMYLAAARQGSASGFKTKIDVQMAEWARDLPDICVDVGKGSLMDAFREVIAKPIVTSWPDSEDVFSRLRAHIVETCCKGHEWPGEIARHLAAMQHAALQDNDILDKKVWKEACAFMRESARQTREQLKQQELRLMGPGRWSRYYNWSSLTDAHSLNRAIAAEITAFGVDGKWRKLSEDDLTTLRTNIRKRAGARAPEVEDAEIILLFDFMQQSKFYADAEQTAQYCKHRFGHASNAEAPNGMECRDVVMFWRLQQVVQLSSKVLRQHVMMQKTLLENEVKNALAAVSLDDELKAKLIRGHRMELAQQIELARFISQQLESFQNKLSAAPGTARAGRH